MNKLLQEKNTTINELKEQLKGGASSIQNSVVEEKKSNLFSTSKKKISIFSEQQNLTSELLKKICELENSNKKL